MRMQLMTRHVAKDRVQGAKILRASTTNADRRVSMQRHARSTFYIAADKSRR